MAVKKDELYMPIEPFVTEEAAFTMDTRVTGEYLARMEAKVPGFSKLFRPLELSFPAVEQATAAPGAKRGA